ncbi:hypothetical protein ACFW2X_01300 [Streptomyces antibioticus]|uniref:hypothetical protein n=1 Tax=Streptomyces antibioticus TaxID=1890 RepID=UPI0036A0C32B
MVDPDTSQGGFGDALAAVEDGGDRRGPDQVGEAPDHAAGSLVQVFRQTGQGVGRVTVQAKGALQRGDQGLPLGVARESTGADQDAAAPELLAADPGEQPGLLDVDPGIDEGRRQVLGEVLQVIGESSPAVVAWLSR